jgi:large-conductance mechanosensitive channel
MEFLLPLTLKVLAFNSFVAGGADAAVEFMVVAFAVWCVVDYVES